VIAANAAEHKTAKVNSLFALIVFIFLFVIGYDANIGSGSEVLQKEFGSFFAFFFSELSYPIHGVHQLADLTHA